ncbi:glycosyltransferase family 39 protein [Streptomyces lunaelactis]|uniref:glycosyltransferase family 39 protein n=1 Tax=Streptomyces lunaelactis TaxID=1535768 RepID=UPI0020C779FD|nr:glycosyltransferase family 39 protein [Streptomyces lunaelactis]
MVALRAGEDGPGLGKLLATRFDTMYYVHIAEYGYAAPMDGLCKVQGELCKYAFYPLYPGLIRGVSAIVPLPAGIIAWGIAVAASLLAAWGIFAVAEHVHDRRTGVIAVLLWGMVPHAMVESMAYTEPLFTAIAAWALYAVLTQRWLIAGLLATLAGLTRPSGAAVVAAVAICAAWTLVTTLRRRGKSPGTPTARKDTLAAAILISPLGWFAWFAWVGHRAGRWDGYFQLQERWGSTFDGGSFTLHRIAEIFTKAPVTLNSVVAALTVIAAFVLFTISLHQRQHAALLIYAAVLMLIAVGGAGYFHSKARFLLPAFPLLFPLAKSLATARPKIAYTVLTAAVLVSSAYGSYLMLVWQYSP